MSDDTSSSSKQTAPDRAVVIPAFPVHEELPALGTRAEREGVMSTHVRTLAAGRTGPFRHDQPDPFF